MCKACKFRFPYVLAAIFTVQAITACAGRYSESTGAGTVYIDENSALRCELDYLTQCALFRGSLFIPGSLKTGSWKMSG